MSNPGYSGSGSFSSLAQASAEQADDLTGEVIGGILEVGELLGKGGMGVVYQVFHREWNRELAMKVPLNLGAGGNFDLRRWVREAHTWIDLGLHPRVVSCWFVREWKGVPILFLDLFSGGSLKEKMAARKGPPTTPQEWAESLTWLIHTAEGLAHAHEMGLVHRDIKPANLLFNSEGNLAVTDFGLGKAFDKAAAAEESGGQSAQATQEAFSSGGGSSYEEHSLTRTGVMTGTPHYAPPEQWMQQQVGPKADTYALGVMAFQILTGRHPFEPPDERWDLGRLVTSHLMTEPPSPRKHNPELPEQLSEAVLRCLAKKPAERPELDFLREVLVSAYKELTGKDYAFGIPQPLSQRADSLNNKAVSLWSIGLRTEAIQAWGEADRLERNHLEVTFNRMVTSWLMGRRNAAEVEEELLELSTTSSRALSALGRFLLSRGEHKRAAELLTQGLETAGLREDGTIWRALGDAYRASGELEKARDSYQRALELIPSDRVVQAALESLCEVKGVVEGPVAENDFSHRGRLTAWTMLESGKGVALMFGHRLVLINLQGREMCSVEVPGVGALLRLQSKGAHLLVAGAHEANILSFVVANGEWQVDGIARWSQRVIGFVDSERLLTGDTTLQVRNRVDQSTVGPLMVGHDKRVWCCAPLANKRGLVTAGSDRVVRLWDLKDAQCTAEGKGHRDYIKQMILARREQLLITGDNSGLVLFFLLDHKLERLQKLEFGGKIERLVVTGSGQQEVLFVQYRPDSEPARTSVVYLDRFHVVFDQPGRLIEWDHGYGLWDAEGFRLHSLPDGVEWRNLRVSQADLARCMVIPHTKDVIFWSKDQKFIRWRLPAEVPEAPPLSLVRANTLSEVQQARQQFASLMEAAWAAYRTENWSEAYWQLSKARLVEGYAREPETLAFLTRLAGKLVRRELREMWKVRELVPPGKDKTRRLAVDESGKWAATATGALIRLWDLRNGTCVRGLTGHRDEVVKLAFWEEGRRFGAAPLLFSFSSDRTVRLWDSNTGECLQTVVGSEQATVTVGVHQASRYFAMVDRGGNLQTGHWKSEKPFDVEMLKSVSGVGFPRGVRVTDNGEWVVVDEDKCLVFHLAAPEAVPKREHELDYVLTKLPTSTHLLGARRDGGLELFDLNDGVVVVDYHREGPAVTAMSCTDDGGVVALVDSAGTLQCWLIDSKQCVLERTLGESIKEIAFSGNGRYLAGLSGTGSLLVWELEWSLDPDQPHAETLEERIPVKGFWSRLKRRFGLERD